jgi:hypothetical protein
MARKRTRKLKGTLTMYIRDKQINQKTRYLRMPHMLRQARKAHEDFFQTFIDEPLTADVWTMRDASGTLCCVIQTGIFASVVAFH